MLVIDGVKKVFPPAKGLLRLVMRTASEEPVNALDGVDLRVDRGEVVGLVGPNGAGKSTLFRIVATLLEPSAGLVTVDGSDVMADPPAVRRRIGLMLEGDRGFYARLTGRQNLEFFGAMIGLEPEAAAAIAEKLMRDLDLVGRDRRVFGYSAGMRVRLALARAMLGSPDLLLLDEPTRSLDPDASVEVLRLVRDMAGSGAAVLMSSHRLNEVSHTCDRVALLMEGRVRFDGPPGDLITATGNLRRLVDRVGEES